MSVSGLILGIINVAIVVAVLLLVGAIILWFCNYMGFSVPEMVRKIYIAVVALIGLYMLIALIFGIPTMRVIGFQGVTGGAVAAVPAATAIYL